MSPAETRLFPMPVADGPRRPPGARPATLLALASLLLAGCGGATDGDPGADQPDVTGAVDKPAAEPLEIMPDQPAAPMTIDYSVMGNPVVGQPVGVNIELTTSLTDRPITVSYRVNESGAATFPESQPPSMELLPVAGRETRTQQVRIVPQREGRIFLVVAAGIEADSGELIKTISIPIRVGRAPEQPDAGGEPEDDSGDSTPEAG